MYSAFIEWLQLDCFALDAFHFSFVFVKSIQINKWVQTL
jgi:hypothetical protein